jgi:hypothetical protein
MIRIIFNPWCFSPTASNMKCECNIDNNVNNFPLCFASLSPTLFFFCLFVFVLSLKFHHRHRRDAGRVAATVHGLRPRLAVCAAALGLCKPHKRRVCPRPALRSPGAGEQKQAKKQKSKKKEKKEKKEKEKNKKKPKTTKRKRKKDENKKIFLNESKVVWSPLEQQIKKLIKMVQKW